MQPVRLAPNQLQRFYRGGPRIAAFRGVASEGKYAPEDWVGSTTAVFGSDGAGLSRLPDGRLLTDAIAAQPERYLGEAHVSRFGPEPALLVKLLDAGERLPVHFHPDRQFARRHLGSAYGKTEAWVIIEAEGSATVHLGFRETVDAASVARWVEAQNTEAMLAALNPIPVRRGDTIFVPAATPHAIGEGILIVELQEPTDFSVLLEWAGFAIDGEAEGHLGLGFERALEALDRSAWTGARLRRVREGRIVVGASDGAGALLPEEADAFFRAERIRPDGSSTLPPAFSLLVVVSGYGELVSEDGAALPLARGETVLVPLASGECRVEGAVELIRCLPPGA